MIFTAALAVAFGSVLGAATSAGAQTPLQVGAESVGTDRPIIRSIQIEVREIFDESNLGFFYDSVNSLKASTKEEVIRRELLLKEGEPFDDFLLDESERNLRSLPFLRRISITPLRDGPYVDLLVSVQDTWTLFPFITLSSGGGTSRQAVGVTEGNLLGYGKRLELLVADDEGREKIEGVWDDRRLLGTYHRLTLGQFIRSDGERTAFSVGRPFRSLVEPTAWSLNSDYFDLVGRLFEAGDERYIFRQRHTSVAGGYTISKGDPEELLRRYTFGYEYLDDDFSQADEQDFEDINLDPASVTQDPSLLADDRQFSGPFVAYQQIEPDFLSINFVDRFERVEDFNLGNELNLRLNAAPDLFGSRRDTWLVRASDSDGWRITPTSFIRGEVAVSSRYQSGGFDNSLIEGVVKYYNILGAKFIGDTYIGKHTIASSLSVDWGEDLDRDVELLLGARDGLRGYQDRTFTGDQRLVLNLEDRFHLVEDVYKLVSIGGAFFLDAGGTSRSGLADIVKDNLYADVGFGLRFALTRSSGGAVVRIDFAFPLRDGPDGSGVGEPRILFTSGTLFGARLPSERLSSQAEAVSAGFIP
ncbi:MAG: hypothetical protein KDD69_14540 [Bdellovibrionales bacterium]|nr:hypothetical protein [Bdellovibrionales bacterium]